MAKYLALSLLFTFACQSSALGLQRTKAPTMVQETSAVAPKEKRDLQQFLTSGKEAFGPGAVTPGKELSVSEEAKMWESLSGALPAAPPEAEGVEFGRLKEPKDTPNKMSGRTMRQHYGFAMQKDSIKNPDNWYTEMQPVDISSGAPANRLLYRDHACVKGPGLHTSRKDPMFQRTNKMTDPEALIYAMNMTDRKEPHPGYKKVKGTMFIVTVHHFNWWIFENIGHASSSTFLLADALGSLKDFRNGTLPFDVNAVLMHQADDELVEDSDWHKQVAKLTAGTKGLDTEYLMRGDLKQGICADKIVLFHRPGYRQRYFFKDPKHAAELQEKAIQQFGLPNELKSTVRKPSRTVTMVVRRDNQGYSNWEEINKKTRTYLSKRCWKLEEYYPGKVQPMLLKPQVEEFAKADLTISVHGAHFQNIVWQARDTATIIIEKQGFKDRDVVQLAKEMGIRAYKAGWEGPQAWNYDDEKNGTNFWDFGKFFSGDVSEPPLPAPGSGKALNQTMELDFEHELKPVLDKAISDLELAANRGPECKSGAHAAASGSFGGVAAVRKPRRGGAADGSPIGNAKDVEHAQ